MKFICPHCNQKIESDDSFTEEIATCPNCHRFRKTSVDPEERARRRNLRLRILSWLIAGTLSYFLALVVTPYIFLIGFILYAITLGVVPGIVSAAWAKFFMLRADWRTGVLAIAILFLAIIANVLYNEWGNFTAQERNRMIREIVANPDNAQSYPQETARDEMYQMSVELREQHLREDQIWKAQADLRVRLDRQYGQVRFPVRYQLNRMVQKINEHPWLLLFRLFGFSIFNVLLAYVFASKAHAFCSIPGLNIVWDAEIPGKNDGDADTPESVVYPMFVFAISVVTINMLIVGVMNILIYAVMGNAGGRSFLMFVLSSIFSLPMIYCFVKCENRRWVLALLVLGIALIFTAIIWRFG